MADNAPRMSEAHGHTEAMPHHKVNYFLIFGILVGLTILTVGVAFLHIEQEWIKVLLALTIASITAPFVAPNGSGKTTLFRILSPLIPPQSGTVRILNLDLPRDTNAIRPQIAVVFQSPSLDKQLTAEENLRHHGHLYGLRGRELSNRIDESLSRFNLAERRTKSSAPLAAACAVASSSPKACSPARQSSSLTSPAPASTPSPPSS